jgi:hypothetical protein
MGNKQTNLSQENLNSLKKDTNRIFKNFFNQFFILLNSYN